MKIVHLLPADGIGGAEVAARHAAAVRADVEVEYLDTGSAAGGLDQTARAGPLWTLKVLFAFGVLGRLRRRAPDVVVFSLWKTGLQLLAWRLLLRRRAILFRSEERR